MPQGHGLEVKAEPVAPASVEANAPPREAECSFCHHKEDPTKVAPMMLCVSCSGYLLDFHRAAAKAG